MIDTGFDIFAERDELRQTLSYALANGLCRSGSKKIFVDFSANLEKSGAEMLATAIAISKRLPPDEKRIGLALPTSYAAAIFNYACIFANKIPVNLNFTLGKAAAQACLDTGHINSTITAKAAQEKMVKANPSLPWSNRVIYAEDILAQIPQQEIAAIMHDTLEGVAHFANKYNISKYGDNNVEATLVFTSGSSGLPKGAILTQRNIIANCLQTFETGLFDDSDVILGNLPVFHSFGLLFEIWFVAIFGIKTVTLMSPLDIKSNIKAISQTRATAMIGSPTFLRAYLKHATPEEMGSMRKAIAGAEKTPDGFEEAWNNKFNNSYLEGYGLTEASPIVSVNVPDADLGYFKVGRRKGSIGKPYPGQLLKIVHPETGKELLCDQRGILAVKGPNVFKGYLNNTEATNNAVKDGWLITGDLAHFDSDGFVYIDGRLSRFSKIGGEMVPHATVESVLNHAFSSDSPVPHIAVSSRVDDTKGEALVILTTTDITLAQAKEALRKAGISNLWQPKHIVRVEEIPLLPSGKLDLKLLAKLAQK